MILGSIWQVGVAQMKEAISKHTGDEEVQEMQQECLSLLLGVNPKVHISLHLAASLLHLPRISLHLAASLLHLPCISLYLAASRCISLYLGVSRGSDDFGSGTHRSRRPSPGARYSEI